MVKYPFRNELPRFGAIVLAVPNLQPDGVRHSNPLQLLQQFYVVQDRYATLPTEGNYFRVIEIPIQCAEHVRLAIDGRIDHRIIIPIFKNDGRFDTRMDDL